MNTKHHLMTILGSIALVACLAYAGPSAYAQSYSLTEMGITLGKKECAPTAINNAGDVTGTASAGAEETAFLYYKEDGEYEMEDIGNNPEGSISRGFGINDFGVVVGDSTFGKSESGIRRASIFTQG